MRKTNVISKTINLFSGTRIIEETTSKYNGNIQVIKDLAWGTYIKADGFTQSGGILTKIWQETIEKIQTSKTQKIQTVLILGLGGGSVATLVHKNWPQAKITGVDIDEKIVKLGRKYLNLNKIDIEVKISDANQFVIENCKLKIVNYDLIVIDLYCGDQFPKKFEDDRFLRNVKKLLKKDGMILFNRLYGVNQKQESITFGKRLEKIFKKVDYVFPQANVEMICYN